MPDWLYYDFENSWEEFFEAWQCKQVQDVLTEAMDRWCLNEAYFTGKGENPKWVPGDDLWAYSRTDYHFTRMMDSASEYINKHKCISNYWNSLRRALPSITLDQAQGSFFMGEAYNEILSQCQPKPGSQEAQVLFMGANYIAEAQAAAAQILFPDDDAQVVYWGNSEIAVVPGRRLLVDFQREFLYREGVKKGWPSGDLSPDHIVGEWEEFGESLPF